MSLVILVGDLSGDESEVAEVLVLSRPAAVSMMLYVRI